MKQLPALAALGLLCALPAAAADKLPPLDAEFLEYLAVFGGDEADWTLFDVDEEEEPAAQPPPAREAAARREERKTEAAEKPAEKR